VESPVIVSPVAASFLMSLKANLTKFATGDASLTLLSHLIGVSLIGGHLIGGHLIGGHLIGGHLIGASLIGVLLTEAIQ
jgi:hypothetical protein